MVNFGRQAPASVCLFFEQLAARAQFRGPGPIHYVLTPNGNLACDDHYSLAASQAGRLRFYNQARRWAMLRRVAKLSLLATAMTLTASFFALQAISTSAA